MNIVDKILVDPITKGLKFFSKAGVQSFSTTPQGMSDQQATALGLKQYIHGGVYNGGLAPTVTLTSGGGTLTSITRAVFVPYQTQDGWRMRFTLIAVLSSTARTNPRLGVAGVTFKNVSGWQQVVAGFASTASAAYVVANTSGVEMAYASASYTEHYFGGDVELDSKPTWAY